MKKVIDAGILRAEEFIDFLRASTTNIAVITDYLAIETFQGSGRPNLGKLHWAFTEFPKQIIILKSTFEIARLYPKKEGLQSRLVDRRQTRSMIRESRDIIASSYNRADFEYNFQMKRHVSNEHIAMLRGFTEKVREGLDKWIDTVPLLDIKELRRARKVSPDLGKKVIGDIILITSVGLARGDFPQTNCSREVIYSFPFRYVLCCMALSLRWAADGGHQTVAVSKLKNDFTDMSYAAYATFYDGILTRDKKLSDVYSLAKAMLTSI